MIPSYRRFGGEEQPPLLYRMLYRAVWLFSPKYRIQGAEKLPPEPCVIVGNHSQMYGPIAAEMYMPRRHFTWCTGEMMNRKEVPAYAFRDFWSGKPARTHGFYRMLSHLIAPLAEYIFTHAHTIPVYRDARLLTTFRKSVSSLQNGADIVIFPEKNAPFNHILCSFQEHFTDLARIHYRKTGEALRFVPMYLAPNLKLIVFGDGVRYNPEADEAEERARICSAMMTAITGIATGLPPHRVVPYLNIPRKNYPMNTEQGGPEETKS